MNITRPNRVGEKLPTGLVRPLAREELHSLFVLMSRHRRRRRPERLRAALQLAPPRSVSRYGRRLSGRNSESHSKSVRKVGFRPHLVSVTEEDFPCQATDFSLRGRVRPEALLPARSFLVPSEPMTSALALGLKQP